LIIIITVLIHVFRIGYFGLVCFDTNFEAIFFRYPVESSTENQPITGPCTEWTYTTL